MINKLKEFTSDVLFNHDATFEVILFIIAFIIGIYVGVFVFFIGGIVQVIEAYKAGIEAWGIAIGIFRVVSAGFFGVLTVFVLTYLFGYIYNKIYTLVTRKGSKG